MGPFWKSFLEYPDISVITDARLVALNGKILDVNGVQGDNMAVEQKYLVFARGEKNEKTHISYYLRDNGKLFYQTDIKAKELPLDE